MTLLTLPNVLTLFRLCLLVPISLCLCREELERAFYWVLVASLTDWLDGFLARRFGWITPLGTWLDPLADKALLVTVFSGLWLIGLLPLWLLLVILLRDLVIVAGAGAYWITRGRYNGDPSRWGKYSTAAQLVLLLSLLLPAGVEVLPAWWLPVVMILVTVLAVISGIHYVVTWWRRWKSGGAHA